jgi:hypothetical protein
MEFLINNTSFKMFYNMTSKKKERFELILEPLQAILQLSLLAFCPKGTKITINQNILNLQMPYYIQGILRWYQNDNKDDLFYLFYVCKRFSRFYSHLKYIQNKDTNLYDLLVTLSREGLNNLIQTYSKSEKISLLHTLELYKLLLSNPNQFDLIKQNNLSQPRQFDYQNIGEQTNNIVGTATIHTQHSANTRRKMRSESEDSSHTNSKTEKFMINTETSPVLNSSDYKSEIYNNTEYDLFDNDDKNENLLGPSQQQPTFERDIDIENNDSISTHFRGPNIATQQQSQPSEMYSNSQMETYNQQNTGTMFGSNSEDIDTIFIKITRLYRNYDFNIIMNTLLILKETDLEAEEKERMIQGLNLILHNTTAKISKWIQKNIVF